MSNHEDQKNTTSTSIELTQSSDRQSFDGGSENFTGAVKVSMLFGPRDARNFSSAEVTFEPGARTAWHTHPGGQTLIVTAGRGWVQKEGEERVVMNEGDVVWIPAGVKHWHGATDTYAMTHTAIQSQVDGEVVTWMEKVSDTDYAP